MELQQLFIAWFLKILCKIEEENLDFINWFSGSKYFIMAITHSNFLTQVRNYTEVDSNVLSDSIIQGFIRNVELDIAGKVDYDDLRKYATSTFTAGNRYVSLPSDALVIRSVQVIDGSSTRVFLEKRDTSFISEYNNDGATGTPKYLC